MKPFGLVFFATLSALSLHPCFADEGDDVMGVKVKRYGRDSGEPTSYSEEHFKNSPSQGSPPLLRRPASTDYVNPYKLKHPLGEGLVYPKQKPKGFW